MQFKRNANWNMQTHRKPHFNICGVKPNFQNSNAHRNQRAIPAASINYLELITSSLHQPFPHQTNGPEMVSFQIAIHLLQEEMRPALSAGMSRESPFRMESEEPTQLYVPEKIRTRCNLNRIGLALLENDDGKSSLLSSWQRVTSIWRTRTHPAPA